MYDGLITCMKENEPAYRQQTATKPYSADHTFWAFTFSNKKSEYFVYSINNSLENSFAPLHQSQVLSLSLMSDRSFCSNRVCFTRKYIVEKN